MNDVVAPSSGTSKLGDRDPVEHEVELAVAGAIEPVPEMLPNQTGIGAVPLPIGLIAS